MSQNPLVTVICLCYNHADYVVESLNSVINQDYKNIELIILDDCSKDESVIIIESWLKNHPEIQFVKNSLNLGNTRTFNIGLQLAKGDFIIDFAADDVLKKNCISRQINQFQTTSFENVGLVYGNCALIDEKGNFLESYFETNSNGKVVSKRTSGNEYLRILAGGKEAICSVSSLIKKEVFEKLNGYDETLAYEDLDFWIRASRVYNFDFIDEIIIEKRVLKNSMGSNFYKKNNTLTYSTYKILKKALSLNKTREEDLALQKRIHHEIITTFQSGSYSLCIKNIGLRIQIGFRKWFNKN